MAGRGRPFVVTWHARRYFTLSRGIDVGGLLLHRHVVYFSTGVYNRTEALSG
jgi:hypothetical protein